MGRGSAPTPPVPVPIRRDAVRTSSEDPSWKPFVVLPVTAAAGMMRVGTDVGGYWRIGGEPHQAAQIPPHDGHPALRSTAGWWL